MKTAKELLAEGGWWMDIRWRDFIKMPDGSFWKPVRGHAASDDVLMRRAA